MRKIYGPAIALAMVLTSCGKGPAQEETCQGTAACTEQSINAPVGEQPPLEVPENYDANPKNPPRRDLGFPAFDSSWGMKRAIFDKAVNYFAEHRDSIPNPKFFTIVDFNLHASKKRLFLFDMTTGKVERHNVAAGKNSDPEPDGFATKFSNTNGSKMSSLGFYQTLQTYNGGHGLSLKLQGLESTNSNALERAVVMHPADYVSDTSSTAGRSWGCPAIDPKVSAGLIGKVKNGSMLLIAR